MSRVSSLRETKVPRGKRPTRPVEPDAIAADAFRKLAGIDLFDQTCAGHMALQQVADKWTMLLIYALADGTKRYGELRKQVRGISAKVLIANLRKLETMGFVTRTVFPVVPPRVDYALTPLGTSFLLPLSGICAWASDHLEELRALGRARLRAARALSRSPA